MYKTQYEKRRIPTETNKYKALLQAIEQGSITAAARELEYSPSGLTRVLDGLERELGLPLLQRSPQGVELTLEGQDLLPAIRELLYWAGQIQERSASLQGLEQGELAIGSYYSIASCWLPAILRDFQRDFPHIRIHVQEAGNRTLLQGLRERKLSCCLFNRNAGYQGDWIPLYQDRLVAWIPESRPLMGQRVDERLSVQIFW
uniref:LysR family transcriptional regulator n=1 Tax=Acidaminococcus timonensis TaxID=1871002 RepID=UPI00308083DE